MRSINQSPPFCMEKTIQFGFKNAPICAMFRAHFTKNSRKRMKIYEHVIIWKCSRWKCMTIDYNSIHMYIVLQYEHIQHTKFMRGWYSYVLIWKSGKQNKNRPDRKRNIKGKAEGTRAAHRLSLVKRRLDDLLSDTVPDYAASEITKTGRLSRGWSVLVSVLSSAMWLLQFIYDLSQQFVPNVFFL